MDKNQIICGDNVSILSSFDDGCIDLTVTSPPYDDLRTYGGDEWDLNALIAQLYRVTKSGGVVVWVVGDQTVNGSETGSSFRQALAFMDAGFNLHDTMIYQKANPVPNSGNRYQQEFEYMFVFSKGKPKTANILKEPRRYAAETGRVKTSGLSRDKDGQFSDKQYAYHSGAFVPRRNIWQYKVGLYNSTSYKPAFEHPAVFPEALAYDHILSWSEVGDTVLDPFCGSGTTLIAAKLTGRNYIGIDVNEEYCEIARNRMNEQHSLCVDDRSGIVQAEDIEKDDWRLF